MSPLFFSSQPTNPHSQQKLPVRIKRSIDSMTRSAPRQRKDLRTTTVLVRPFYLTPLLIAVAYFLARPLPTKSS